MQTGFIPALPEPPFSLAVPLPAHSGQGHREPGHGEQGSARTQGLKDMWELELVAATRTLGLSKAEIVPEDGVRGEENQFPEKGRCWATGGEEQRAAQSLQSCTRELFMNNV